jgi:hypothetical protein
MDKKVVKVESSKGLEPSKKPEPPKVLPTPPPVAKTPIYALGEVFANPYLGCKFTEVLTTSKERAGWIWTHTDGRVVVMLGMGFHLWYNEGGADWTVESGCLWLVTQKERF